MALLGTYPHTLDAKNRLTVPSRFRGLLGDQVILAKAIEPCIGLWTPDAYEAFVAASLSHLNPLSPQARQLRRYFSANAFLTPIDGAGRVMVPAQLLAHAGVAKEVVVNGNDTCLEIWDRERWAQESERLTAEVVDITAAFG
ncbi:MAG TPA: division/cell wall cluster transcriptional repressor MraZ [Solirubrobacteraceae bacterium]|nr:division/cell wall cluster transcriptional repressor MraZ [Solirubrobacteraceae bacterium]